MSAIKTQRVFEDSGLYLMARVTGSNAANMVQADVSSISLVVTKRGGTPGDAESVTVSSVVFNTLQTDARWTKDATGYNFRYEVSPTQLGDGEGMYYFEFKFTPASGPVFHVVFEVETLPLQRS